MSNLVECDCCNEMKECITCAYNHNTCLNCKANSGLTFDTCFFCNPIVNEEQNEINEDNDNERNYTKKELIVLITAIIIGCLLICITAYIIINDFYLLVNLLT